MSVWADDRVRSLIDGYHAGQSLEEIAFGLGVTKSTVIGKLWRLGLSGKRTSERKIKRTRTQKNAVPKIETSPRRINKPGRICFRLGLLKDWG